jgi:hypothetical protein
MFRTREQSAGNRIFIRILRDYTFGSNPFKIWEIQYIQRLLLMFQKWKDQYLSPLAL